MTRLLRDHTTMPWRNGAGTTHEVARHPADGDADWRVSFADVVEPGPFSAFPGIDRVITLVDGERIDLVVDGVDHALMPFEPYAFAGEAEVTSTPVGETRDLNLMVRRDAYEGAVECVRVEGEASVAAEGGVLLVAILDGSLASFVDGARAELQRFDVLDAEGLDVSLDGVGVVAVIRARATS